VWFNREVISKILSLRQIEIVIETIAEYYRQEPEAYLLHYESSGLRPISDLRLKFELISGDVGLYDKICVTCAKSSYLHVKLMPYYLWHDQPHQRDGYVERLKSEPLTLIHIQHTKETILHALALNMRPD